MTPHTTNTRCVDAETLAAWAEGTLPAAETASVEQHLSTCARCQSVLAAFVRSAPAPAVVIPFWSRRPVQWGALGLAAAAALFAIVWTGDTPPSAPQPETTVASAESEPSAPTFPPIPTISSLPPIVEKPSASAPSSKPVPAPKPSPASPTLPPIQSIPTIPPIVNTPPPPPPPQPTTVTVQSASPMVAVPATVAAPTSMAARDIATDAFEAIPVLTFEVVAPAVAPGFSAGRGGGRGGAGGSAGSRAASVTAPVLPPTRWRVVGGTTIERSADGGTTWINLAIEPPITTLLTAGAAASQTACWFVGRRGLVMLTADGVTASRVSFPETADLVSVSVEAMVRVIVTTADGRAFASTDAGATWMLVRQ